MMHTIVRNFERNANRNFLKGHSEVRLFGTWTQKEFLAVQSCTLQCRIDEFMAKLCLVYVRRTL